MLWIALCMFPDQVSSKAGTAPAWSLRDVKRWSEGASLLHGHAVGDE